MDHNYPLLCLTGKLETKSLIRTELHTKGPFVQMTAESIAILSKVLIRLSVSKITQTQVLNIVTVINRNKTPYTTNLLEKGSYFDSMVLLADFGEPSRFGFSKLVSLF